MRVFVTGASGWIGRATTDELLANGHTVVGLARSDASAEALAAKGVEVHRGDLSDPAGIAAAAAASDGVVHLAFNHDFSDYAGAGRTERAVVDAMIDALAGSDRPLVIASGLAGGPPGVPLTEDVETLHRGADAPRGGSESLVLEAADRGVRSMVVRFAPTVHGLGGDHGFVAVLAAIAAQAGEAGYVDDGATGWAAVHRSDAARVVRLAVERGTAGGRYHAVGETAIASKTIAEALGARLGVPAASVPADAADERFSWLARFWGADVTADNARTRERLGWEPTGPGLLADIAAGAYDVG